MLSSLTTEPIRRKRPPVNPLRILGAGFTPEPSFVISAPSLKGLKGRGLRFEASVIERIRKQAAPEWVLFEKEWFRFETDGGSFICQPDLFLVNFELGRIIIVEVKLSRTSKAWYQLKRYAAVLQFMFPEFDIAKVEVATNVFATDVPEKVRTIWDIFDARVGATSFMKMNYDAR